ncbi:MAG: cytochrome c oxidase subunit II [Acidobacteria bacterium 13_1_20CM_3_53_8]|nr:MAG: cytochrome c oxidase subunit II [Acidobacteria bacterium 13_1_20CM_3_53_8]
MTQRGALALAAAWGLMLSGCGGVNSSLNSVGPQAARIEKLWWLMFYVCSAVFVLVMIALFVSVIRARQDTATRVEIPATDEPELKPEPERERRMTRVVVGATAVTVLIIFVFLVASFFTGRAISSPLYAPQNVLTIEVTGHQWWWEVRYDDATPSRMFTTANEIHVPVGQPVLLQMTSRDVIHSFWAPNIHGKKDLIPGKSSTLYIEVDHPGMYRGQCAEFCGHQHANMGFYIIAESPEDFNRWRDSQAQPAVSPVTDSQKRGQQVFLTSTCVMCHTIRGTLAAATEAPDLTHFASRQTFAAGTLPNTRGHLAGWVVDSQSIKPGNHMPPNSLESDDLMALLDYLENLK